MAKDKTELKEPEIPAKSDKKQEPTPTAKKQVQKKFSKFEKKGK